MAQFAPNKPEVSEVPVIEVDKGLLPGVHVFQLRVEDNLGQVSDAAVMRIIISPNIPSPFDFPIPPIVG